MNEELKFNPLFAGRFESLEDCLKKRKFLKDKINTRMRKEFVVKLVNLVKKTVYKEHRFYEYNCRNTEDVKREMRRINITKDVVLKNFIRKSPHYTFKNKKAFDSLDIFITPKTVKEHEFGFNSDLTSMSMGLGNIDFCEERLSTERKVYKEWLKYQKLHNKCV